VPPGSGVGCCGHRGKPRGWSGCWVWSLLGAGVSSHPAGPGLAVVPSPARWHEVGKGHLPRGAEVACSQPGTVGFSCLAGDISGAGGAGGLLLSPSGCSGVCLSFPFGAGCHLLCPLRAGCQVGAVAVTRCRALCGGMVGIRSVGRVLGMLSATCKPSAPLPPEGWQEPPVFAEQRLPCRGGSLCCGEQEVLQGVVNARKPEQIGCMAGLCLCPGAAAQGHEHVLSPQPRHQSPSMPSAGLALPADRLHVGTG